MQEERTKSAAAEVNTSRRRLLLGSVATLAAGVAVGARAQSFAFKPNQRYPDPAVLVLDPSFAKYRIYSSTVEQVATGMRWEIIARQGDGPEIPATPAVVLAQKLARGDIKGGGASACANLFDLASLLSSLAPFKIETRTTQLTDL